MPAAVVSTFGYALYLAQAGKRHDNTKVEAMTRRAPIRIERGSTNGYADLGFPSPDEMLVKAQLVTKIAEILAERGETQMQAAALLGIPQPKLSKMLRGQFRGISERKLMDCLTRLGRDVDIVVRTPKKRGQGAVSVSFA